MNAASRLDAAIKRVVESGNCSGCGACALLDNGISMELDTMGYLRPVRRSPAKGAGGGTNSGKSFAAACPGVRVRAQRPDGSLRHPQLGPVTGAWQAWASDPETRFSGSSGGAITALSSWLLQSGHVARVVGAGADPIDARRTVPVQILSREQALAASGSRYAPVANASAAGALEPGTAFIGKPCEVSAARVLSEEHQGFGGHGPILLSFFCAGTPSQHATDRLAAALGAPEGTGIRELRYRGNGWPGNFSVMAEDGTIQAMAYDESWGKHLGPATQWRCKICPDGVAESADITAGDFWRTDDAGYPLFTEQAGISALIARTRRGRELVLAAAAAGVLTLHPLDAGELMAVQPLQRRRRETLLGRLAGTVAGGGRIPHFSGFSLPRLAAGHLRESLRAAMGSYRRQRAIRREPPKTGARYN